MYLVRRSDSRINIELEQPLLIVGDIKVDFSQKIKLDLMNLSVRVLVKLCRFVGKPRLLLIQQRNFWDFLGKLQEKVRISLRTF